MNLIRKLQSNLRLTVQIIFTALTNGYLIGYMNGRIYKGESKK